MRLALLFAQGPLEPVWSRRKQRERLRPRLCAVHGIEAVVRPSTLTADLLTAATSAPGRIVLRSAHIAPKRPPGAIANADLRLLPPRRRRPRPSVTEAAKPLVTLPGRVDLELWSSTRDFANLFPFNYLVTLLHSL